MARPRVRWRTVDPVIPVAGKKSWGAYVGHGPIRVPAAEPVATQREFTMRLLLTLAAVASLAACSHNNNDNTTGQAAPETGRVSTSDTSKAGAPPATGTVDTNTTRMKPDTAKTMTPTTPDTSHMAPPTTVDTSRTGMKHDSM